MRILVLAMAALLGACAGPQPPKACATNGIERVGGPIALVDGAGAPVTEASFAGKPALLYFGFASCPDICPTALQTMRSALDQYRGPALQPVFVTIDPERDTPETLARYVASDVFPQGLRGLTGSEQAVADAAAAFKAYRSRRADPGSAIGYTYDHTSMFYLMDAQWRPAAVFADSMPPADMARCMEAALAAR